MKKLIFLFFIFIFLIFTKSVNAYTIDSKKEQIYLGGETIGIKLDTGVTVSKLYGIVDGVNLIKPWEKAGLKENDIITRYNDSVINDANDLVLAMKKCKAQNVSISILRKGKVIDTTINPYYKDDVCSLGIYVKDNILGVGTLTYIIPSLNYFSALGHQIETNTQNGDIFEAKVTGINKGYSGVAGSKKASISNIDIGDINKNTITGVHGKLESIGTHKLINLAKKEEIVLGDATIYTTIKGSNVEKFSIVITEINLKQKTKCIKFIVNDNTLIRECGGIVQGMSGSPIVQNDKLIGAVTHVVVNNPKEGYGIFIENMLEDIDFNLE